MPSLHARLRRVHTWLWRELILTAGEALARLLVQTYSTCSSHPYLPSLPRYPDLPWYRCFCSRVRVHSNPMRAELLTLLVYRRCRTPHRQRISVPTRGLSSYRRYGLPAFDMNSCVIPTRRLTAPASNSTPLSPQYACFGVLTSEATLSRRIRRMPHGNGLDSKASGALSDLSMRERIKHCLNLIETSLVEHVCCQLYAMTFDNIYFPRSHGMQYSRASHA